jgi:hypothetical protein
MVLRTTVAPAPASLEFFGNCAAVQELRESGMGARYALLSVGYIVGNRAYSVDAIGVRQTAGNVVHYFIVDRDNSVKVCLGFREGLNQADMSARNIYGEA